MDIVAILEAAQGLDSGTLIAVILLALVIGGFWFGRAALSIVTRSMDRGDNDREYQRSFNTNVEQVLGRLADSSERQADLERQQLRIVGRTAQTVDTIDRRSTDTLAQVGQLQAGIDKLPDKIRDEIRPLAADLRQVLSVVEAHKQTTEYNTQLLTDVQQQLTAILAHIAQVLEQSKE